EAALDSWWRKTTVWLTPPEELVAEAGPSGCGKILASVQLPPKKLKQPLDAQLPELQQYESALNTVERWVHPP
ncbi:hypothetical protein GW17_00044118, partial [Ensete ventricosum]